MIVLFPSHPLRPKVPEESFVSEAGAAKKAGFTVGLVDTELQLGGEVKIRIPADDKREFGVEKVLYRGWLLKPEHYREMNRALDEMDCELVTSPEQYLTSYMLPNWYRLLDPEEGGERTPRSIILPGDEWNARYPEWHFDLDHVAQRVHRAFGSCACIVKDYLKTQKHRWAEACFIPNASDEAHVKNVVETFLRLTGPDLVGGLVFRQFENFQQIGIHPKIRTPLFNEWRAWMCKGKVIHQSAYWADGDYASVEAPSVPVMEEMASPLRELPFVAVDFAKEEEPVGPPEWRIVEVNDGGAAGIPKGGEMGDFYRALAKEFV